MLNAEVEACAREKNVDLPFLHQLLQVEKTGMNDPDVVRAESRRNALSLARLVRGGGQGIDLKR